MRVSAMQVEVDLSAPYDRRVADVVALVTAERGRDLIVLPELWPSGGFDYDQWQDTAEPFDGPLVRTFASLAVELTTHLHMGSFVERRDDGSLANTSVLFAPTGDVVAVYRKIHLFGFGAGEPKLMSPGDQVVVADTKLTSFGLATCYDLRFPEQFRLLIDAGARVVVIPAAWPSARIEHWSVLARARAIEGQAVIVAVNTVGSQAGQAMGGRSVVVSATGEVLAEAGTEAEMLRVDVDLTQVDRWRREFPVLEDRRL